MKICILLSSHDGIGSLFEGCCEHQNPGMYVKSHQFEQRIVTKENAKEKIDEIIKEGFDYIWNFMWGPVDENIAGVDAIKYLESTDFPMIGTSSKFLSLTKLDYKRAILSANIKMPKGIVITGDYDSIINLNLCNLKYPLIVKPAVGCGSEHLTPDSVCQDLSELVEQIKVLKDTVNYEIIIEEFIEGEEIAVIILETKRGVIALEPLIYKFPQGWKSTQKFLDFDIKFYGTQRDEVTYKVFDEDVNIVNKIKETGIRAYEALGVFGSGYARVDFRLKGTEPYVLEVNPTPAFFYELGNKFGDDLIIESTFPGGHEQLVDDIISSKMRIDTVVQKYNKMSSTYDSEILKQPAKSHVLIWKGLVDTFDFSGTVLDLGCGTGLLGNLILEKYKSEITGIDVSIEMVKFAKTYETVHVGLIENIIFDLSTTYNHVISSASLLFVDERNFRNILSRMFDLATKSITLTVEEVTEEYKSTCEEIHTATVFNHLDTIQNFPIPIGWSLVHNNLQYLWEAPLTASKIYGLVLRYEKVSSTKKDTSKNVKNGMCVIE